MIKSRVQIYMPVDGFNFISVPGNQSPDLMCVLGNLNIPLSRLETLRDQALLTLDTLTLICIISILFSLHLLRC